MEVKILWFSYNVLLPSLLSGSLHDKILPSEYNFPFFLIIFSSFFFAFFISYFLQTYLFYTQFLFLPHGFPSTNLVILFSNVFIGLFTFFIFFLLLLSLHHTLRVYFSPLLFFFFVPFISFRIFGFSAQSTKKLLHFVSRESIYFSEDFSAAPFAPLCAYFVFSFRFFFFSSVPSII